MAAAWYKKNKAKSLANNQAWEKAHPNHVMWIWVKKRATRSGIDFSIQPDDIIIPEFCPLLGIRLQKGQGVRSESSPSVDRIDNQKGYIPGNVWVISFKANTMKSTSTLDEFELMARNWRNQLRT